MRLRQVRSVFRIEHAMLDTPVGRIMYFRIRRIPEREGKRLRKQLIKIEVKVRSGCDCSGLFAENVPCPFARGSLLRRIVFVTGSGIRRVKL